MKEYDEMCLVQESNPTAYKAEKSVVMEHITS
jgi:hypothetical protein